MKVQIKGIHHIALKGRNLEEYKQLLDFYHGIYGMPIVREWGDEQNPVCMVDTGAGMLELFANAPDRPDEGALRHIAFEVEDVDACIEAARAAGYEITIEPKSMTLGAHTVRLGFCIGPVGEEVEFFCVK